MKLRRLAWIALVLAVLSAALWARFYATAALDRPGSPTLYGTDPYYHLRRAWLTLHQFPSVPYVDRFCEYPLATRCHTWPGGFDLLLASVAGLTLGRGPALDEMVRPLALVPPVLGALTVLALIWVAWRPLGSAAALLAGALLALMPASVMLGAFARVDHHVLEPLLALLFLYCYMRAARGPGSGRQGPRWWPDPRWCLAGGLLGSLSVASIPSSAAHLVLCAVVFALDLSRLALRGHAASPWQRSLAAGAATLGLSILGGLAYFATTPCWGSPGELDFSPFSLGLVAAAEAGLLLLGLGVGWLEPRGALTRRALLLWPPTAALACLGMLLLLVPGFCGILGSWVAFLAGSDLSHMTGEWWSVLSAPAGKTLLNFTPLLLLLPAGAALSLRDAWRRIPPGSSEPHASAAFHTDRATVAHWVLVMGLLGLVQAGYFRSLVATAVALAAAGLLAAPWTRKSPPGPEGESPSRTRVRLLRMLSLTALTAALIWTGSRFAPLARDIPERDQAFEVLGWLRSNSPPQDPLRGASTLAPYGVLADWQLGHWINVLAQQPSTASPHLPPRLLEELPDPACRRGLCRWVRFAMAATEGEAVQQARAARSRYLVLGLMDPARVAAYRRLLRLPPEPLVRQVGDRWDSLPGYWSLVHQRLMVINGSATRTHEGDLPALTHFRLLAASSRPRGRVAGRPLPWYKVFEVMPRIARARGLTARGALVLCELRLRTSQGREEMYFQVKRADDEGKFTLALPYEARSAARENASPLAFRAAGPYRLRAGDQCATLWVTEEQVRAGAHLAVRWSPCKP